MIVVDLQQVMVSNLMAQIGKMKREDINEDLLRHMILNSIRAANKTYSDKYGELVLACDSRHSWRKDVFPYYKANRKEKREEQTVIDWKVVFESFSKIKEEVKSFLPYRMIQVDGAEGDDVIATIVHKFGSEGERILILSGDRDFVQLHQYSGVEQFDPVRKKVVRKPSPSLYKAEHIIRGDKGDGIPNILMGDNSLVIKERQKPIFDKKIQQWVKMKPEEYCDEKMLRHWYRNQLVIDLDNVPKNLQEKIMEEYEKEAGKNRRNILSYFIKYKLKNLTETINDF
jgi:5'-3' exonuclease